MDLGHIASRRVALLDVRSVTVIAEDDLRLSGVASGYVPPAEYEERYYAQAAVA